MPPHLVLPAKIPSNLVRSLQPRLPGLLEQAKDKKPWKGRSQGRASSSLAGCLTPVTCLILSPPHTLVLLARAGVNCQATQTFTHTHSHTHTHTHSLTHTHTHSLTPRHHLSPVGTHTFAAARPPRYLRQYRPHSSGRALSGSPISLCERRPHVTRAYLRLPGRLGSATDSTRHAKQRHTRHKGLLAAVHPVLRTSSPILIHARPVTSSVPRGPAPFSFKLPVKQD